MHIYAFGSIVRGEVGYGSDVDLLACSEEENTALDREKFSIYGYIRLQQLWSEGNPFAWHLYSESKLIYSTDETDFIGSLGIPQQYSNVREDCDKFYALFKEATESIESGSNSKIFNLSCMFLAMRNFATCYSLGQGQPIFSRRSPLLIEPKLRMDEEIFSIFLRARILSTRGFGEILSKKDVALATRQAILIFDWMQEIRETRL